MPETLTLKEAMELASKLPQIDDFEAMVREAQEKMEVIDVCVQD